MIVWIAKLELPVQMGIKFSPNISLLFTFLLKSILMDQLEQLVLPERPVKGP